MTSSWKSRVRLCSWVLLLVSACFSESPSSTGDTGAACPAGTNGCPCDGGTCEGMLVCHEASSNCYEPECTLGSASCPCVDGQCLGTLSCVDDFCEAASGSEGTTVGSMSMSDETSEPPPVESTTTSDEVTSVDPATATTVPPSDSSEATTDETQSTTETDNGCIECLMNAPPKCGCTECVELAECYYDGTPIGDCCQTYFNQAGTWNEYVLCNVDANCGNACGVAPLC